VLLYRHQGAPSEPDDDEIQLENPDVAPVSEQQIKPSQSLERTRKIIEKAKEEAAASRHVFVDSVDVLMAMLREPEGIAGKVLADLRIDVRTVARCLREEVSRDEPSAAYLEALTAKSLAEAKWLGHEDVGTEHLLLALCEIRPSAATDILMRLGVQPRDICKEVLQILGHHDDWQGWLADHPDM